MSRFVAAATLALRFRTENIRFAAGSRANTMLVMKALSQDVMILALVPLFADPRGVAQSPLQSTYSHGISFNKCQPNFGNEPLKRQVKRVSLNAFFLICFKFLYSVGKNYCQ
ncbi:hypothetical protein AMS59_06970 [Lysinibacillus sp. FJAT-14745]|uniref:hypothetical protein n=1 Tax=Lysinibacillus sp. FJAT-14745 TaxID=1704289 RepID=UPI0006ABC2AD|nr:hypothetical protein [Lysinibacillus sp. FJAT-14745]KOP79487.1 hypothetical protein AMS59_06970 [Lysinibacillus sp. FJAT-14745]